MTGDITEIRYWLDLGIKAIIGIAVSVVGMDYRAVKNSLQELEQSKYHVAMQVQVMQSELDAIKNRLQRIEDKLDKALDR
jgi:predicted  nucleic acid-binding Zn-ribbon protein